MQTYLLTFLSILVSAGLFWVGYRRTVGARQERIRTANNDLEKLLLRRIILESCVPTPDHLSRLINGKAREHRVKPRDLLSEVQLLETVFTRVAESDFVAVDQRNAILERLSPILTKAEESPLEEILIAETPSVRKQMYNRTLISLIMGVFASFVGALVLLVPELTKTGEFSTLIVITGFAGSFALITLMVVAYRFRESTEETSGLSAIQSAINFEKEVSRVLTKTVSKLEFAKSGSGFDFIATVGDKKILLEVKSWSHRVPKHVMLNVINRLRQAIDLNNATEAIIITNAAVYGGADLMKDSRIRVMSLREFRNYVAHGGA